MGTDYVNDLDQSIVGWKRRKESIRLLKRAGEVGKTRSEDKKRQAVEDFKADLRFMGLCENCRVPLTEEQAALSTLCGKCFSRVMLRKVRM